MNMNEYNYTSAALELFAAIVTAIIKIPKGETENERYSGRR